MKILLLTLFGAVAYGQSETPQCHVPMPCALSPAHQENNLDSSHSLTATITLDQENARAKTATTAVAETKSPTLSVHCDEPYGARLISLGAAIDVVQKTCGKPQHKEGWSHEIDVAGRPRKQHSEELYYWTFNVIFTEGKATQIIVTDNAIILGRSGGSSHPKLAAFLEKADQVATQMTFSTVCPKVYRTPLILMDANAYQWLQACNANGYMLFGGYVYIGGK